MTNSFEVALSLSSTANCIITKSKQIRKRFLITFVWNCVCKCCLFFMCFMIHCGFAIWRRCKCISVESSFTSFLLLKSWLIRHIFAIFVINFQIFFLCQWNAKTCCHLFTSYTVLFWVDKCYMFWALTVHCIHLEQKE